MNVIFKKNIRWISPGVAKGHAIGGNLSLICTLIGTGYLPSFKGSILFFEDINEPAYRVDRMLTQCLLAGAFDGLAGVIVGDVSGDKGIDSIIKERFASHRIPIAAGLPFGHIEPLITIAQGVSLSMNSKTKQITVTEAAVK